jgi:hypothetical protein
MLFDYGRFLATACGEGGRRARRAACASLALGLATTMHVPLAASPPSRVPGSSSPAIAGEQDLVVVGTRRVVIDGRARPCVPLPDEPLDRVSVAPPEGHGDLRRQSAIVPSGRGRYAFVPDFESVTGPDFWQRAGTGLDQYKIRSNAGEGPLCIGARWPDAKGHAQLRRILDAKRYHGKRVRFTAWAATEDANLVRFWLSAGAGSRKLYNGGNTNNQPWGGNHGWTPILLEIGPIDPKADHVSYGFLLSGHGDVWVFRPKLEIVPDSEARTGDVAVIGVEQR